MPSAWPPANPELDRERNPPQAQDSMGSSTEASSSSVLSPAPASTNSQSSGRDWCGGIYADSSSEKPVFPLQRPSPQSARLELGVKDRLIFRLMVAAMHALSLLPDFVLYRLGVASAMLFHRFDKRHARIGMRNLEIAFPERTDAERRRILRASYVNLGRNAAEYIRLGGFFYRRLKGRVTYRRLDIWNALKPKYPGKGALILTAHFGSFELLPSGHALHGFQIALVHHTQRFIPGDALMTFIRERVGVQIIRKHRAAREMLRTLKRGDLVGIPFDQNAKRSEAIWVPFFGEMAATPSGFDRLALMAGAPVVPVFIVRQPDGRSHIIEIFDEVPQQRTGDKDADALVNTARYQAAIEAIVRKYPEQWLWTHRRYRTRPVRGTPSPYD